MMNYIWGAMIIIGIVYATATGDMSTLTDITINSAKGAVTLSITMLGIMGMWSGLMNIAEQSGLIAGLTRRIEPALTFLFPKIPKDHKANKYIAANFIANILGLGWAATPAGLKAMEELQKLNKTKHIASNEMCMFLVVNMSSLQLISVNLLAYRAEYSSANPAEAIGPGIAVTLATTVVGIIICKMFEMFQNERTRT